MPGLLNASAEPPSSNEIWSKKRDDITFDQLQKFWSELPLQARQQLLRIDKQTLFEQARKNMYCSRCNGLLLEGFSQIVMYGKSLQQESAGFYLSNRTGTAPVVVESSSDDIQDPAVHPWGGLATTKDGILTLLDCFMNAKSLKVLQNVFDSARARERERELLYPDACGGGGRGWISQGMALYGRAHGTRETCALHTARLSCDTLVDFWSALGEETRTSLLRMKEEDFIERLMYRFDSKRFCRDCRRNVIREFKELKELRRMRRELRCTSWFCVADTAFQCEVSENAVEADWHQSFSDSVGTYHHFEWAIGTGEGKSDISDFKNVGMNGKAQENGLNLGSLSACFITLRAWKLDGRCTELCVKAHALKGQVCVHRRLVVGDGFVTITKGESIRSFFEHAEEAEEEEDDDATDKDGNEIDGDGSRPQKHAKSPELAREFLLDAATVIFKEQVEKAFREGTARQNAHSIFVSLALKLLEERVHVACKEIITLEKQIKLLEEEEKEKQEEEERRERRKMKEREKKLRRKERLKGKERDRERKHMDINLLHDALPTCVSDSPMSTHEESSPNNPDSGDSISDPGEVTTPPRPVSPDIKDDQSSNMCSDAMNLKSDTLQHQCHADVEFSARDSSVFILEQSKSSRRKLRFKKDTLVDQASKWYDKQRSFGCDESSVHHEEFNAKFMASRSMNGGHRPLRERVVKSNARNIGLKFSEKFHCTNSRLRDRYDFQSCSCNNSGDYRPKDGYHISMVRSSREIKAPCKIDQTVDVPRSLYRGNKHSHGCFIPDNCILPKGKLGAGALSRDGIHTKQVWEPTDARRKCTRSNYDPDVSSRTDVPVNRAEEDLGKVDGSSHYKSHEDSTESSNNGLVSVAKSECYSKDNIVPTFPISSNCGDRIMSSSSSDNCSSCLSEGDSGTSSSSAQNAESSSTSDSEDASPQSGGRDGTSGNKNKTNEGSSFMKTSTELPVAGCAGANFWMEEPTKAVHSSDNGGFRSDIIPPQARQMPLPHNQSMHSPSFPSSTVVYQNQNAAASWSASSANRFMTYPQADHFVFPSDPLGYSLPSNRLSEFNMQYNPLQTMTTPLFTACRHPMYQTGNRAYIQNMKEQIKNYNSVTEPMAKEKSFVTASPNRRQPSESPSNGQNGCVEGVSRSQDDTASFSLFHFGGPISGAAGFNVNPILVKEENSGKSVSKPAPAPTPRADVSCSKEETEVEEYSLFAASNGARFSFF